MNVRSLSRRELLSIVGVSAGVVGGGALIGQGLDSGSGGGDGTLTACSFNILHDTPDAEVPWSSRLPRVVEALEDLDADLIGFQEVMPGQRADLQEALEGYKWYGIGREGDDQSEAVTVAWSEDRFEVRDRGNFWLSSNPEEPSAGWGARNPRVSTWASLTDRETGTGLWFCNTHFSWADEETRLRSAELIRQRAVERAESGRSVVLTGDLNAEPDSSPHNRLRGAAEGYPSPLVDGRRAADAESVSGPERTYHAFSDVLKDRVDYVFTPREADVLEYRTLEIREGGYRSDHLPVAARFRP